MESSSPARGFITRWRRTASLSAGWDQSIPVGRLRTSQSRPRRFGPPFSSLRIVTATCLRGSSIPSGCSLRCWPVASSFSGDVRTTVPCFSRADTPWLRFLSLWLQLVSRSTRLAQIHAGVQLGSAYCWRGCRSISCGRARARPKRGRMPVIDFHNHYYPPAYLDALERGPSTVHITHDDEGNPLLHYPGDYNVAVRGHRDIDYREQVFKDTGVDIQVITLTTPGTHIEEPATAARLASMVNDIFACVVSDKKGRFAALATLPLNDPAASVTELRRAMEQLHFRGAMVFSNINGVALSDQRFWKLYEAANELGAVMHIHPTNPVGVEAMLDYWLMPLVGFLMDTTLAAASLVFSGVVERFPNIRWALAHLGGAIPYLAERLDRGYEAFSECRKNINRPPSAYLKNFYFDTVNFDPAALELAVSFAGADHVLAGSDFPHQI